MPKHSVHGQYGLIGTKCKGFGKDADYSTPRSNCYTAYITYKLLVANALAIGYQVQCTTHNSLPVHAPA